MLRLLLATTLLASASLGQKVDGKNEITYPDTSLSLNYKDKVVVSYETDYETPWMYIFCDDGTLQEIIYYAPSDLLEKTSITFELSYDYMPTGTCFFNLRPSQRESNDNDIVGATSSDFDYDSDEGDSKTYSIGSGSNETITTATTSSSISRPTNATATTSTTKSTTSTTSTEVTETPSDDDSDDEEHTHSETGASTPPTNPEPSETPIPGSAGVKTAASFGLVIAAAFAVVAAAT
jgi:hypothetical protein